jgi:hypothetical protein
VRQVSLLLHHLRRSRDHPCGFVTPWWEAEARKHMKAFGFEHRQIRNITANKRAFYEGKIVGDSPEMCRALDSQGFADLKAAITAYSS